MEKPFESSFDHLLAELNRVETLLSFHVQSHLARAPERQQKLVGAYLDATDVRRLLKSADNPGAAFQAEQTVLAELAPDFETACENAKKLTEKRLASRKKGIYLRLDRLRAVFNLTALEEDIVLLTLLAEIDSNVGQLFSYLNDDLTQRFPTVRTVIGSLAANYLDALKMQQLFAPISNLKATGILIVEADDKPLALRRIRLSQTVSQFLLEIVGLPDRLVQNVNLKPANTTLKETQIEKNERAQLEALCMRYQQATHEALINGGKGVGLWIAFEGLTDSDHLCIANGIANQLNCPFMSMDLEDAFGTNNFVSLIKETTLFARLSGSLLFFSKVHALESAEPSLVRQWIETVSNSIGFFVFDHLPLNPPGAINLPVISVHFSKRNLKSRMALWKQATEKHKLAVDVDLMTLASTFNLDIKQIQSAVNWARGTALLNNTEDTITLHHQDLQAGCRQHADSSLQKHATKIEIQHNWEDLILPTNQLETLREICLRIKHQYRVYGEWGMGKKISYGKGVAALFSGLSGTGKTMAAEIMAGELGQDIYRVDLSALVSKYIGETEKNLNQIFDAAQSSNIVLFFDEADAIFGKRSEVTDSHDRYANIQTAYLLQRMEAYEGIAILATNLKANTDEAFIRRLDFLIEFPFPEPVYREKIWRKFIIGEMPLGNIDYALIANRFRLSGGAIRNAVVTAAFVAAEENNKLEMHHILHGIKREFQKMGALITNIELMEREIKNSD